MSVAMTKNGEFNVAHSNSTAINLIDKVERAAQKVFDVAKTIKSKIVGAFGKTGHEIHILSHEVMDGIHNFEKEHPTASKIIKEAAEVVEDVFVPTLLDATIKAGGKLVKEAVKEVDKNLEHEKEHKPDSFAAKIEAERQNNPSNGHER